VRRTQEAAAPTLTPRPLQAEPQQHVVRVVKASELNGASIPSPRTPLPLLARSAVGPAPVRPAPRSPSSWRTQPPPPGPLADEKAKLERIDGLHIYSLQPRQLGSEADLWQHDYQQSQEIFKLMLEGASGRRPCLAGPGRLAGPGQLVLAPTLRRS
jgi:hypothetical protein